MTTPKLSVLLSSLFYFQPPTPQAECSIQIFSDTYHTFRCWFNTLLMRAFFQFYRNNLKNLKKESSNKDTLLLMLSVHHDCTEDDGATSTWNTDGLLTGKEKRYGKSRNVSWFAPKRNKQFCSHFITQSEVTQWDMMSAEQGTKICPRKRQ